MVVKISYNDNSKSIYKCDRCKKNLIKGTDTIILISNRDISKNEYIKRWHLCKRCFLLFNKAIERGVQK